VVVTTVQPPFTSIDNDYDRPIAWYGRVALAVFVGRVVSTLGNLPDVNQKNADDMAVPSLTEIVIVAAVAAVVLLIVWNFKFRKRP
jgi:hypothetical protein